MCVCVRGRVGACLRAFLLACMDACDSPWAALCTTNDGSPGMAVHVVVNPFEIDIAPAWIIDLVAQLERKPGQMPIAPPRYGHLAMRNCLGHTLRGGYRRPVRVLMGYVHIYNFDNLFEANLCPA